MQRIASYSHTETESPLPARRDVFLRAGMSFGSTKPEHSSHLPLSQRASNATSSPRHSQITPDRTDISHFMDCSEAQSARALLRITRGGDPLRMVRLLPRPSANGNIPAR